MSIFKRRRNLGSLLLGIFLVAAGLRTILRIPIPYVDPVLALLAIAAGILILMDR